MSPVRVAVRLGRRDAAVQHPCSQSTEDGIGGGQERLLLPEPVIQAASRDRRLPPRPGHSSS